MRPLHLYLALYFAIVLGALLTLWEAGILGRMPVVWTVLAAAAALGLGLLVLLTSPPPVPPAGVE
jgi:hypothetical protein